MTRFGAILTAVNEWLNGISYLRVVDEYIEQAQLEPQTIQAYPFIQSTVFDSTESNYRDAINVTVLVLFDGLQTSDFNQLVDDVIDRINSVEMPKKYSTGDDRTFTVYAPTIAGTDGIFNDGREYKHWAIQLQVIVC